MNYKSLLLLNMLTVNIIMSGDLSKNKTDLITTAVKLDVQEKTYPEQNTVSESVPKNNNDNNTVLYKIAKYGTIYMVSGAGLFVLGILGTGVYYVCCYR